MATRHGCNEVTTNTRPDVSSAGNSGGFYVTCKLINNKDPAVILTSS